MTGSRTRLILIFALVTGLPFTALPLTALAESPDEATQDEWTAAQAIDEIDQLIARGKARGPLEKRFPRIAAWLVRVESSGIDLGKEAYVRAFPLYMVAKRARGAEAVAPEAMQCLGDHIAAHGGLPESVRKSENGPPTKLLVSPTQSVRFVGLLAMRPNPITPHPSPASHDPSASSSVRTNSYS